MQWHEQAEGRCLELSCLHDWETYCTKRCESEGKILEQLQWLRRAHWEQKKPWMVKVVYTSPGLS